MSSGGEKIKDKNIFMLKTLHIRRRLHRIQLDKSPKPIKIKLYINRQSKAMTEKSSLAEADRDVWAVD